VHQRDQQAELAQVGNGKPCGKRWDGPLAQPRGHTSGGTTGRGRGER
jgi:hypothetical protein